MRRRFLVLVSIGVIALVAFSGRGVNAGLAVELPWPGPGSLLISFATESGGDAMDGPGRHSPYAEALAEEVFKPGVAVQDGLSEVRRVVLNKTGGHQAPTYRDSTVEAFQFMAADGKPALETRPRLALVIGNSKYGHLPALVNPTNDAKLIASKLASAGFAVDLVMDGDQKAMTVAFDNLRRQALDRKEGAVVALYYAGHGVRVGGVDYMIPVDAATSRERDLKLYGLSLEWMLGQGFGDKSLAMFFLDTVRNNPFANRR